MKFRSGNYILFIKSLMYHTIIKKNNNNSNKKKSIQNSIESIQNSSMKNRYYAIHKENKFSIINLCKFSIFSNSFVITNKKKAYKINQPALR